MHIRLQVSMSGFLFGYFWLFGLSDSCTCLLSFHFKQHKSLTGNDRRVTTSELAIALRLANNSSAVYPQGLYIYLTCKLITLLLPTLQLRLLQAQVFGNGSGIL